MGNERRIKIPRASDRGVIDCFRKLGKQFSVSEVSISALAFSQLGRVNLFSEENTDFQALVQHDSTLIDSCSLQVKGLSISYQRGGPHRPQDKSPIFDEILLGWNPQQGDLSNVEKLNVVSIINEDLKAFEPGRFIKSGLSEEQTQLLSIHSSTLDRLQKINEDLIRQSSEFRENIERRYEEKVSEHEQQTIAQRDKLNYDFEGKDKELKKRENSFSEKLAAIDDRNNTHVRREIRDRMLADVKARIGKFGVSESTEGKRRPVFFGIVFMIIVILGMLGYSIYEISQPTAQAGSAHTSSLQVIYWLWAKVTFLSIGLLGAILYYVKWQNRWAEQYANSESQLQQFYIDVNRANWVIESCLEWRKETDSAIPAPLIESITRNLFNHPNEELEKVIHPSDEFASALLGSASRLKMKVGDSELEFNKPSKIISKKKSDG